MPGKTPKRLVHLQNRDFRYVNNLPAAQRPSPGIQWSSCNSTINGSSGKKGKGGGGDERPAFQTATGVSYLGWKYQKLGEGIIVAGLVFSATIIGATIGLPAMALGGAMNAWGTRQTVGWSRPCSDNQDTAGVTF